LSSPWRLYLAVTAYQDHTSDPGELIRQPAGEVSDFLLSQLIPAVTGRAARRGGDFCLPDQVRAWLGAIAWHRQWDSTAITDQIGQLRAEQQALPQTADGTARSRQIEQQITALLKQRGEYQQRQLDLATTLRQNESMSASLVAFVNLVTQQNLVPCTGYAFTSELATSEAVTSPPCPGRPPAPRARPVRSGGTRAPSTTAGPGRGAGRPGRWLLPPLAGLTGRPCTNTRPCWQRIPQEDSGLSC